MEMMLLLAWNTPKSVSIGRSRCLFSILCFIWSLVSGHGGGAMGPGVMVMRRRLAVGGGAAV